MSDRLQYLDCIRRPTLESLAALLAPCGLSEVVYDHDDRGYFVKSCVIPDWFSVKLTEAADRRRAFLAETKKDREPVRKRLKRQVAGGRGVTAEIFNWSRDNPEATKEEALGHFAHYNRSTVLVQFGKARKLVS